MGINPIFWTQTTDIIRSALFIIAGFEALSIALLYLFGYQKMKPSKIIGAMVALFFVLGVYFVVNSIVPLANSFRPDLHGVVVLVLIPLLICVIITLEKFRTETMCDQKTLAQKDDPKTV